MSSINKRSTKVVATFIKVGCGDIRWCGQSGHLKIKKTHGRIPTPLVKCGKKIRACDHRRHKTLSLKVQYVELNSMSC